MANTKSNANPVIVGYIDGMGNEYCLDHHEEHTTLSFRLGGKIKVVWGKQRNLDACTTGCVTCLEANALIGAWLVG